MDPRLARAERIYRTDGPASALPEFTRLLAVFETSGEQRSFALAQGYIGACHWRLGNYEEARRHLDISLELKRKIGDELQTGKTLNILGLLEWDLGNFDAAIEYFSQASEIGKRAGDARLEGATLNNLSLVYDELGDYRTSLEQYHRVLDIYGDADFPRGKGDTLGNIGGVYLLLGQFSEAERHYSQALEISIQLESVAGMSQDHGNLGLAFAGMGKTGQAQQHFDRALELAAQAGLKKEQGQWLRGRGNTQIMAGRYDQGLEDHRAALQVLEAIGAQTPLLDALHDMGELLLMLGDPVSAEQYFRRAMTLARDMDMPRIVALNQLALGDLQYRHQRLDAAAALYKQALQRGQAAGEKTFQSWAWMRLARVRADQGDTEQGTRASQQALATAREIGARGIESEALYMQAELSRARGEFETALQIYEQAGALASEVGDPDLLWRNDFGRALSLEQTGQFEEAIYALQSAVAVIESVRAHLQEKRYRSGYLQDKYQVYMELVRLQMKVSRSRDAFSTAERLRNWTYAEQTGLAADRQLTEEQLRTRHELRERIRRLQSNLEDEQGRAFPQRRQLAIDTFSSELMLAEREYQALLNDMSITAEHPPTPVVPGMAAAVQQQLRPDQALIEYVVGMRQVTIFVLTRSRLVALEVPSDQDDVNSRLELLRNVLQQRHNDRWVMPSQSLADTLLQPVIDKGWLNDVSQLYLVPHGMLNYLPFALLPIEDESGRRPVIARFALALLPAATSLLQGKDTTTSDRSQNLLAMAPAASKLPYAREEVRSIGALFSPDAELLLGKQATESSFKSRAGDFDILHLATHGYFNPHNPLLSGLQLEADNENDGILEVHEILELRLDSVLVTLSACKTGLGSGFFTAIPAGDDFVGMTRAFLQVGSTSVLATLWEVEDRSTVDLMKAFYGHLGPEERRLDKAGALASAQRTMLSRPSYEHPYYWAPFVLVGAMGQDREDQS
jgi:CHAT domain-containing protein/tetratricopeptide (TPR) repeat protein